MNTFSKRDKDIIVQNFDIETKEENPSEEDLFQMLCDQIAYMIEYRMEYLLSLLYRNDVEEAKINFALSPICEDPANVALAKLVMDRQRQRINTKKNIEVNPIEGIDDELKYP